MVKTLRDNKGRYAGSIGAGKTRIPTPSKTQTSFQNHPSNPTAATPNIKRAPIVDGVTPALIKWVKTLTGTYDADSTPGYYDAIEKIFTTAEKTTYLWGPQYNNPPTRDEITHARQLTGTYYAETDPHYSNYVNKIFAYTKSLTTDRALADNPQLAADRTAEGRTALEEQLRAAEEATIHYEYLAEDEIEQAEEELENLTARLKAVKELD